VVWSMATAPVRHSSPRPAACLLPSSLSTAPERSLLATAVPHPVDHGCRAAPCFVSGVFQKLFPSVSSVCCNSYICMLQVYVSSVSVVSYVCFTHFICIFHVFHLYVSCVLSWCCDEQVWFFFLIPG
jgi:hypothetical protein